MENPEFFNKTNSPTELKIDLPPKLDIYFFLPHAYLEYTSAKTSGVTFSEAKIYIESIIREIKKSPGKLDASELEKALKKIPLKKIKTNEKKLAQHLAKLYEERMTQKYKTYTFPSDEIIEFAIVKIEEYRRLSGNAKLFLGGGYNLAQCYMIDAFFLYCKTQNYPVFEKQLSNYLKKYSDTPGGLFSSPQSPIGAFKQLFQEKKEIYNKNTQKIRTENQEKRDKAVTQTPSVTPIKKEQSSALSKVPLIPISDFNPEEEKKKIIAPSFSPEQYQHSGVEHYDAGLLFYKQKDYSSAMQCFKLAAAHSLPAAKHIIGHMFLSGEGVNKNETEGLMWLERAAEMNSGFACMELGGHSYGKKEFNKAFSWFKKGAYLNDATSQFLLSKMYMDGIGTTKDEVRGFFWMQMAANQNLPDAQWRLGWLYIEGRGTPKDEKKGFFLIQQSAVQNFPEAMFTLGMLYSEGLGTPKDDNQAFFWIQQAAQRNDPEACERLSVFYAEGKGTKQDENQAKYWSNKAVEFANVKSTKTIEDSELKESQSFKP